MVALAVVMVAILDTADVVVVDVKRDVGGQTFMQPSGRVAAFRDRKMALNWGAHRPRRYFSFEGMLEILRSYETHSN